VALLTVRAAINGGTPVRDGRIMRCLSQNEFCSSPPDLYDDGDYTKRKLADKRRPVFLMP
jgi:hypothetical protein